MTWILLASTLIRLVALAGSAILWWRVRNWQLVFPTVALALMTLEPALLPAPQTTPDAGLAGLAVSVLAVLSVFVLTRTFVERQRMDGELRQQTRVLRSILDHMGDGVVVVDERGRFTLCNPAGESLAGMGQTEVTPNRWVQRYGIYLPDRVTPFPTRELPLTRAMRGEAVDGAALFIRHESAPEGRHLSATARPLRDEQGAL